MRCQHLMTTRPGPSTTTCHSIHSSRQAWRSVSCPPADAAGAVVALPQHRRRCPVRQSHSGTRHLVPRLPGRCTVPDCTTACRRAIYCRPWWAHRFHRIDDWEAIQRLRSTGGLQRVTGAAAPVRIDEQRSLWPPSGVDWRRTSSDDRVEEVVTADSR
jgi:hypothetical protein